jgi:hypothetical protein
VAKLALWTDNRARLGASLKAKGYLILQEHIHEQMMKAAVWAFKAGRGQLTRWPGHNLTLLQQNAQEYAVIGLKAESDL